MVTKLILDPNRPSKADSETSSVFPPITAEMAELILFRVRSSLQLAAYQTQRFRVLEDYLVRMFGNSLQI